MTTTRKASAVIVAGLIFGLVSGAALGVVWSALAPRVPTVISPDGVSPDAFQPEQYFSSDIAFGVLALVAGVAVTIGLAYMRREHLASVLVSALLASAVGTAAMWFVGTRLGSVDIEGLQATTTGELVVDGPLQVSLSAMYLMWPLASAGVVTFLALGDWLQERRRAGR
ncbi:MAG TPA: hypothetical protein DCQ36_05130 [Actinobacteria bacterium]|jgi:hypothetical protein|nr:hypothetical protein [Actinomycetota bacterium]